MLLLLTSAASPPWASLRMTKTEGANLQSTSCTFLWSAESCIHALFMVISELTPDWKAIA